MGWHRPGDKLLSERNADPGHRRMYTVYGEVASNATIALHYLDSTTFNVESKAVHAV